jgi:galactofuranose transport system ATP-binding protein
MTDTPTPLLRAEGIDKSFGGVPALRGASLGVAPGEVHALVGENGAGKSTLIKIITGVHRGDAGSVEFDGRPFEVRSPQQAQERGISTIYQEINLVPMRSVAENVFLGREPRRLGLIDWKRMNSEARTVLDRLGLALDVTRPLGTLDVAIQQMVAIARAVSYDARLVIMDEPTSSLDEREVETLFEVVRQLKRDEVSTIFISHRLDELYAVCDRVTIMRDGETVRSSAMGDITKLELIADMLGKDLGEVRRSGATGFGEGTHEASDAFIEGRHIARGRKLRDATLEVGSGEIVALAGLLGSGRTEVARTLAGADIPEAGEIRVDGSESHFTRPKDAIEARIGYCSEDRKTFGIVPHMSVRDNMTLALLPALSRRGIVDREAQDRIVDRFIERLGIKTAGPDQPIGELSGGNQQKVLLARALALEPRLLIVDEPTRGIDVGAKAEIQSLINELADEGLAVLMISSELEEIIEGADRVVVMRDGRSVAELERDEISQDAIMNAMAHGEGDADGQDGSDV